MEGKKNCDEVLKELKDSADKIKEPGDCKEEEEQPGGDGHMENRPEGSVVPAGVAFITERELNATSIQAAFEVDQNLWDIPVEVRQRMANKIVHMMRQVGTLSAPPPHHHHHLKSIGARTGCMDLGQGRG